MANDYFKFKQFTVRQDKCAMKVTTVACIQGAWLPNFMPTKILDIGAGTGLLSLMGAQKYACPVDAVEIEDNAFGQLRENIDQSPWSKRIDCFHEDIRIFSKAHINKYDLIISNPPFYKNQLQSPSDTRNLARHELSLTVEELMDATSHLLKENGLMSVLLPPEETMLFETLFTQKGFCLSARLEIADNDKKKSSAVVSILSRQPCNPTHRKLVIKNPDNTYTQDFISLLKDYYLYM